MEFIHRNMQIFCFQGSYTLLITCDPEFCVTFILTLTLGIFFTTEVKHLIIHSETGAARCSHSLESVRHCSPKWLFCLSKTTIIRSMYQQHNEPMKCLLKEDSSVKADSFLLFSASRLWILYWKVYHTCHSVFSHIHLITVFLFQNPSDWLSFCSFPLLII